MIYDHEKREAILANGRRYVPAVFTTEPRKSTAGEPCFLHWYCGLTIGHKGECRWNR